MIIGLKNVMNKMKKATIMMMHLVITFLHMMKKHTNKKLAIVYPKKQNLKANGMTQDDIDHTNGAHLDSDGEDYGLN